MAAYTLGRDSEDVLAQGRGDVGSREASRVCVPLSPHRMC